MKALRIRIGLEAAYFIVACGILSLFTYGSYFCSAARTGQSHVLVTARLAIACTVWDAFAGACGAMVMAVTNPPWRGLALLVATVVAGVGFGSISSWIYNNGRFLFEGTWADVSCFFTEGYGLMFLIVVAPTLSAATLMREWLVIKMQTPKLPGAGSSPGL